MQLKKLDSLTYVGPQIALADMAEINRMGVRTIVVARPEGEEGGQPDISAIREAADVFGIQVRHIPVISGNVTDQDVDAYGTAVAGAEGPVLAYCRSGMRATTLWALDAATRGRAVDDILEAARNASFDLTSVTQRLNARASEPEHR